MNWNNINRVRLQKNSRPGFSLGYGEALTRAFARVDRLPLYDIYEPTPFSLATAAGFQITALRQADREPMGALCGVCLLASGRDNVEDSQQAPAGFHTGKIPCKKFLQG